MSTLKEHMREFLHHVPLARFSPVFLQSLRGYNTHMLSRDVSAGLTVGMVALPLAMAFFSAAAACRSAAPRAPSSSSSTA